MMKDNFFKKAAFMKNKTLFLSLMIVMIAAGVWIVLAADLSGITLNTPADDANISGTYVFNATVIGYAGNVTFYYNSSETWVEICSNGTSGEDINFSCSYNTNAIPNATGYIVNATAYNASTGDFNSTSITSTGITFDNAVPTVSEITSPTNNTWITGTVNMTIAINGSDVIDDTLDIAVYVNGTINQTTVEDNVTEGGTYVTLTDLLDNSTYLLILEVTDDSGNKKNSSEFILKYDTAKPYSSSLYPTDGSYVNDATPLIYALVSDPGSGIVNNTYLNISQDGTDIDTKTVIGSSYQVNVSYTSTAITEGHNTTIRLNAKDTAGNSMTQASWWFVIDTIKPAVTGFVTNDTDYNVTNTTSLNFSVTVADSTAGVSTVTMNGTTLAQIGSTNVWFNENTTANFNCGADGDCVFGITATDAAGNTNTTETLTLKIDNINPAVTSFAINDSDYNVTSTDYLNFSVTVADSTAGVSTVTMNGTTLTSGAGNTWYTVNTTANFSAPTDGSCEFLITAIDNAGNTNTTEIITIKIDDVNPVVTSFAINDSDYNVTSTVYLNFSVTVTDSNISTVIMNGTSLTQAGTTWYTVNTTANFSAPTDGSCEFLITATDLIGNLNNTETITIKIDDVNPVVTSFAVNHTNYNVTNSTSLNFSVTVADSTAGVSTVTMNGTSLTQAGTTWYTVNTTADFTCGADGDCVFLITATDNAGNVNSTETITLRLDNVNPVVSISYPTASQNISATIIEINGTASDINNVTNANITINDSRWGPNLGTYADWYFQNTSEVSDGDYSIKITANDSAGNLNNTETVTFTVDNAAPTASAWVPGNNSYSNSASPTKGVNISDGTSGVLNSTVQMEVKVDTGAWINITSSSTTSGDKSMFKITHSGGGYSNGNVIYVRANAQDYAGNLMSQAEWQFTVDLVNPAVTSFATNDTNYNVTNTTSLNFSVTVTDTGGAGVSTVTMNGTTLTSGAGNTWYTENTTADFDCGADGDCVFGITATDDAGNTNTTETLTLKIDNINPAVTGFRVNDTSSDNITRSDIYLNFSVTVTDTGGAGVSTVTMNGTTLTQAGTTWYTVNTTANFSAPTDGSCEFLITATDDAGNTNTTETMTIIIDDVNPTVTEFKVNDTNYNVTNTTSLNFSVTVGNGGAGISTVTMNDTSLSQIGTSGVWYTENTTAQFDCGADGNCVFGITATDNVSNVNDTEIITLLIDNINPVVTGFAVNGTDNIVRSADYLNFSVTVTDATANVSTVTINGTSLDQITGTDVWYNINQTDNFTGCTSTGACTFLITATDYAGNVNNTEILTITIDDDNPGVFSFDTNDTDNIVRSADYLNFSVTVNDTGGGSVSTVTINGTSLDKITGTDVWYNINQTDNWTGCTTTGACTFLITATDNVSNVNATETLTITIDDTNPAVTGFAVNDTDYNVTNSTSLNFSVTVVDTHIDTVTMNGTSLGRIDSTNVWYTENTTSQFDCGADGDCVFLITATDNVSNVNDTETITLNVDNIAPTSYIGPLSTNSDTAFTVNWSATDPTPGSGVVTYDVQVKIDDGGWADWRTTVSYTSYMYSGTENHTYYFRSRATDYVGNTGSYSSECNTTVTTAVPTITFNENSYGPYSADPTDPIDVDFSDTSGLDKGQYKIGANGTWTNIFGPAYSGTTYTTNWDVWNSSDIAEGTNTIYVRAYDDQSNLAEPIQTITYIKSDTTAPSKVTGLTLSSNELEVTIQWVEGSESDIDFYVIYRNNTPVDYISGKGSIVATNIVPKSGYYIYNVSAVDTSGNEGLSSDEQGITVSDVTPPAQVEGLTALVWTGGANRNIMFNWTANTESDLDYYKIYVNDEVVGTTQVNQYTYATPYDGTWTVNVSAVDTSGNEGTPSTSESITIDITAPEITAVNSPTGAVTTTTVVLNVTTNEAATCKYSTTDIAYASMASTMTATGGTVHNATITGLDSETTYNYYIRCNDTSGNYMASSTNIRFTPYTDDVMMEVLGPITPTTDNTPMLNVRTYHSATCKFSADNNTYLQMTSFSTTGGTTHQHNLSTLTDNYYNYYISCLDGKGPIRQSTRFFEVDTRSLFNITRPDTKHDYWLADQWHDFTLDTYVLNSTSLTNYNVTTVLTSVDGNYDMIYAWNSNTALYTSYVPGRAVNDLLTFNVSNVKVAYTIYTNATDRLEIN